MHWNSERPNRPQPMERWVFVTMIALLGSLVGMGLGAAIEGYWPTVLIAYSTAAGGALYVRWRLREAGWP